MIVVQFLNAIIMLLSFIFIYGQGTFNKFEEITDNFQKVFLYPYKVKSESIIYDNLFVIGVPKTEQDSSSLYNFISPSTPSSQEFFFKPLTDDALIIKLPTKYVFSYIATNKIYIILLNQDMSKDKESEVPVGEYIYSDEYLIPMQNGKIVLIGYKERKIQIIIDFDTETPTSFEPVESTISQ